MNERIKEVKETLEGFSFTRDLCDYDLYVEEIQLLKNKHGNDIYSLMYDSYKLGYMKARGIVPAGSYSEEVQTCFTDIAE